MNGCAYVYMNNQCRVLAWCTLWLDWLMLRISCRRSCMAWVRVPGRTDFFWKGCLSLTKYIYVYYQFIKARRNKNFGGKASCWIYHFPSWWKIIYLIVFSLKFLLETLENILKTNISVKKLLNILFSVLMEINILLVYIYSFFHLLIFTMSRHMLIYIYIYCIVELYQNDSGLESCKYLILDDSITQ